MANLRSVPLREVREYVPTAELTASSNSAPRLSRWMKRAIHAVLILIFIGFVIAPFLIDWR